MTVSIGEAAGIGASLAGIGAGLKGLADYHTAKALGEKARNRYRRMVRRIRRKAAKVQTGLEAFAEMKLQTYTGIIRESVETLSAFQQIDLSSFQDIQVEHISFLRRELGILKGPVIRASDVLSCLSTGFITAANDRIPYKATPALLKGIGELGANARPAFELPPIPYAALAMAGLSWGMRGNAAKARAGKNAARIMRAVKKMGRALTGLNAILDRITEGENLIYVLTGKLREVLPVLRDAPGGSESRAAVRTAISLTKALKELIETDICTPGGLLNAESGVRFQKIHKEYAHV
ncbi:MAG: hypothetical protein LBH26_08515 [Treponema sp.]|nr:hypothetical protein [Treponema sp.]